MGILSKLILVAVVLWAAFQALSGDASVMNQIRLFRQNEKMLQTIDSLSQVKSQLDLERSRLRSDTAFLEIVVRSELGMSRPNEKVYRLYEKSPGSRGPDR